MIEYHFLREIVGEDKAIFIFLLATKVGRDLIACSVLFE
jgi:hypothetical protein